MKVERRRINTLEEGNDVDLGHMQVDGAGLTEMFRTMQELKKEILKKTVTRDQIINVEKDFADLKSKVLQKKPDTDAELEFRQSVNESLSKMQKFDSSLQSLQM